MHALTATKPAEDLVVTIERVIDAPRELVFEAFTDPNHLAQFWGPNGFTSAVREIDLRPGGAFRLEMCAPDGVAYLCEGVYREIVAPERIVYLGGPDCGHACGGGLPPHALVTITFTENGGKTTLSIETRFESASRRAEAVKTGFNAGWAQTLDRLAAFLQTDR